MRDTFKKLTGTLAAVLLFGSVAAGCGSAYKPQNLAGNVSGDAVSNGGFVAAKGDYVYFINGSEDYTADNTYGDVVRGALLRIAKTDLQSGNYAKVQTVIPMLFVAQDMNAGIYLYDEYVYFASPTTEKERDGTVSNNYLSFKKAKLNGSSTEKELKENIFRLDDNSVTYRYVKIGETVYCLYVDGTQLYSVNTKSGKTTLLVSGADKYYFDETDPNSGVVYYTMKVTQNIDSVSKYDVKYNQIYAVRADATVVLDADKAAYTAKGTFGEKAYEKKYDFDKAYLEENEDGFKADDFSSYPYVNLGQLVLDGKGASANYKHTMFNQEADKDETPATPHGFTYTVQSYENGGLYFTRSDVNTTSSDAENTVLYYLADSVSTASDWTTIGGNESANLDVVALDNKNASAEAIFLIEEKGGVRNHTYLYADKTENKIYKVSTQAKGASMEGDVAEKFWIVPSATSVTLFKTEGNYLYYYAAGSNGNNLSVVDYTGAKNDYDSPAETDVQYTAQTLLDVDWTSAWYKPEFLDNILFYSNAKSFGSTAYNYIYTVNMNGANDMMTPAEIKAFNEKYEEVNDYIDEFESEHANLHAALQYYFRTGETKAFDEFIAEARAQGYKDHYRYSEYEINEFKAFTSHQVSENADKNDYTAMFGYSATDASAYYGVESYFYNRLSVMDKAHTDAIEAMWRKDFIKPLPDLSEEDNTAKIVWIVVGSVLGACAVAAAITIPLVLNAKKKAKLAAEQEVVTAYKRKIDTTDDKSIDVYADDEVVPVKEEAKEEAPAEEAKEEAPAEEAKEEAPAEEAKEEAPAEEAKEEAPAEEAKEEAPAEEAKEEETGKKE